MYILLSSSIKKRYRDDILRCFSAPIGTRIQFRYAKDIVAPPILANYQNISGQLGLVCNVDLSSVGGPCPLIPIRQVVIEKILLHGSTISLSLIVQDYAHGPIAEFTTEVATKSGNQTPTNTQLTPKKTELRGFFFFELSDNPINLTIDRSIAIWENIAKELSGIEHFKNEPAYWGVIGIKEGDVNSIDETDTFVEWPKKFDFYKEYTLLIYIFYPQIHSWRPQSCSIRIEADANLISLQSNEIKIDSPYDMKRWAFKVVPKSPIAQRNSWFRIEQVSNLPINLPEDPTSGPTQWDIDLPLNFRLPWFRTIGSALLFGILVSSSPILTIWKQPSFSIPDKVGFTILSFVFGVGAAFAALYGIK